MTKYSESFKEMIVDLANNGTKAKDLSSEYGISEATIYKWKKLYTKMLKRVLMKNKCKPLEKK